MDESRVFAPERLWVPEFIADPYPTYRRLRAEPFGTIVVRRYILERGTLWVLKTLRKQRIRLRLYRL
jgi:hypothetical protein